MAKFNLRNLEKSIMREVAKVIEESAETIQARAKQLCPTDTGELRDSIIVTISPDGLSARVSTAKHYAVDVEYGNHHQAAEPFMRPAFDATENSIEVEVVKAIDRGLKG